MPAGQGLAHGTQSAWATTPSNAGTWAGGSLRMSSSTPSNSMTESSFYMLGYRREAGSRSLIFLFPCVSACVYGRHVCRGV